MSCTVTGEPYTVFGYGGKQVRDNIHAADVVRAFEAFHARPAAGGRLQPRRRAREQLLDARGDRRCASGSPGASSTGRCSDEARIGDHRWWISRPVAQFQARLPGLGARRTTSRTILREIHDANVERWTARRAMKLSVVIPAHNEEGSIERDGRRRSPRRSSARAIDYEIIVVDDALHRRHRARSSRGSPSATRACAACARPTARLRLRGARRPRAFEGDAVAIVMADGSDDPARPRPLLPPARGGLRLRVRLALHARRRGARLPARSS